MSQRCVIPDAFKFAADRRSLAGEVAIEALARLADQLVGREGAVQYRVEGVVGPDGRSVLKVSASGKLSLQCQRCLTPMSWPFDLESALLLVRSEGEIPEGELEDEERDAIEVTADLDVLSLVEDEILLAIPIVPRHEVCDPPQPAGGIEKESPFSVLSGLKKPD